MLSSQGCETTENPILLRLNQHLDKAKKSLKKSSFIWRLPGPPVKSMAKLSFIT